MEAMQGYLRSTKLSSKEKETKIPGVIYGQNLKENINLFIDRKSFNLFFQKTGKNTYATVVNLTIDKKEYTTLIRDIQWKKDSTTPYPMHIDFFEIGKIQELNNKLYIKFLNYNNCTGVKKGGKLVTLLNRCNIISNPHTTPSYLEINLKDLDIGKAITIKDIEAKYSSCNLKILNNSNIAMVLNK